MPTWVTIIRAILPALRRVTARRVLAVFVALVAVATAVGIGDVASSALHATAPHSCDNMAGECVRARQYWALRGMGFAGLALTFLCLFAAFYALWRHPRWWHAPLAAAGSLAFGATDPMHDLDNRYEGWFSISRGQ
jgi:hypothetical protein